MRASVDVLAIAEEVQPVQMRRPIVASSEPVRTATALARAAVRQPRTVGIIEAPESHNIGPFVQKLDAEQEVAKDAGSIAMLRDHEILRGEEGREGRGRTSGRAKENDPRGKAAERNDTLRTKRVPASPHSHAPSQGRG